MNETLDWDHTRAIPHPSFQKPVRSRSWCIFAQKLRLKIKTLLPQTSLPSSFSCWSGENCLRLRFYANPLHAPAAVCMRMLTWIACQFLCQTLPKSDNGGKEKTVFVSTLCDSWLCQLAEQGIANDNVFISFVPFLILLQILLFSLFLPLLDITIPRNFLQGTMLNFIFKTNFSKAKNQKF